ncbi:hypothetical protein [Acinetobacter modestus]|uniref:hypothetical protein n=1 Tax=Acinetobacter modestus TaxID=1776740 RepID=UPI00301B59C9
MAEFDQFLPSLTPFISNSCPRIIMLNALKSAVRLFCEDSEVWVHDCPPIEIIEANTSQVRLDIPYQTMICKMWTIEGRKYFHNVHRAYIQFPHYHLNADNYLIFEEEIKHPPKTLRPVVSLATTQDSLSCPDFIYQRYHDAIISKCVVILQSMPAQEWSNPSMLAIHEPLYAQHLEKAIKDRNDGFMLGRQTTRIKPTYM